MKRTYKRDLIVAFAAVRLLPHRLRARILAKAPGVVIGEGTLILHDLEIAFGGQVSIGSDSFVNAHCYIDAKAPVHIGRGVLIGDHVRIITSTHPVGPPTRRGGTTLAKRVKIGDGSWVASSATILPGVSIGAGCIVAAGAVVTTDCEPNGLYAGVPARRKKDLPAS